MKRVASMVYEDKTNEFTINPSYIFIFFYIFNFALVIFSLIFFLFQMYLMDKVCTRSTVHQRG